MACKPWMYWSSMAGEGSSVSVGGDRVAECSPEVDESASVLVRSMSRLMVGSVVGRVSVQAPPHAGSWAWGSDDGIFCLIAMWSG